MKTTKNFLYFTQNFTHNFVNKVWEDEPRIAEHLEGKFTEAYEQYGSHGAVLGLFFKLSGDRQEELLTWVDENYNGGKF